jgi:hypothetical protein
MESTVWLWIPSWFVDGTLISEVVYRRPTVLSERTVGVYNHLQFHNTTIPLSKAQFTNRCKHNAEG